MLIDEQIVGDFKLTVTYVESNEFNIVVESVLEPTRRMEKNIPCLYVPRFGVDVDDQQMIYQTAEEMCVELENDAKVH